MSWPRTPTVKEKADKIKPLFVLVDYYLSLPGARRLSLQNLTEKVVFVYLSSLAKMGIGVPAVMKRAVREELTVQTRQYLRGKTYGKYSLGEYQDTVSVWQTLHAEFKFTELRSRLSRAH